MNRYPTRDNVYNLQRERQRRQAQAERQAREWQQAQMGYAQTPHPAKRKKHRQRRRGSHMMMPLLVFAIIALYLVGQIGSLAIKGSDIDVETVAYGTIDTPEVYTGLILREEYVVDSTRDGQPYYQYSQGDYVPKGAGEYKEIMQVGLEYIGEVDAYATLEVLLLAQKSLKTISDAYILDVSHMGFVAGLMEEVALPYAQQDRILDCISEKNIHGIRAVCKENSVAADLTERLEGLASLYGSLEETLPQAKALCCNEKMEQAVQELENILRCLKIGGNEEKVNLDFSIVNDMDYYTGIIFQGFINGVPSSILSGGRYDNLLRKLGKDADAIGFAVYLDLLERFDSKEKEYDVDTLLLYEEGADVAALAQAAQMLTDNGQSVLVQRKNTGNVKYKQLLCMKDRGLEIVAELD